MHGRGLKIVLDASFWASLDDEALPTANYVGDLSSQDLSTQSSAAAPQADAVIHYLSKLSGRHRA